MKKFLLLSIFVFSCAAREDGAVTNSQADANSQRVLSSKSISPSSSVGNGWEYKKLINTPFIFEVPSETISDNDGLSYSPADRSKYFSFINDEVIQSDEDLQQFVDGLYAKQNDRRNQDGCMIGQFMSKEDGKIQILSFFPKCKTPCEQFYLKYQDKIYHLKDGCDIEREGKQLQSKAILNVKLAP